MLDTRVRPLINPLLDAMGRALARAGLSPDAVTLLGVAVALGAVTAIALHYYALGCALVIVNRILDGVDGSVARLVGGSDFGGYLDIVADYVFYAGVPFAFALADPAANALPAAALLASFILTASSFLAYAILAEKHGHKTEAHGKKSFFYSTGLIEGTETVVVLIAVTAFPEWFVPIAWGTAALCIVTALQRLLMARRDFASH